jgi:hypothetical protein
MKSIDNQTFCACHAWQEKGASRVETFYGHRAEAVSDGIQGATPSLYQAEYAL